MVEDAELRLLLGHGEFGQKVDEVHRPRLRHAVAILVDLCEVVAGVEENDGNIGQSLPDNVEDDHVLGLEAVGDANIALRLLQLLPYEFFGCADLVFGALDRGWSCQTQTSLTVGSLSAGKNTFFPKLLKELFWRATGGVEDFNRKLLR